MFHFGYCGMNSKGGRRERKQEDQLGCSCIRQEMMVAEVGREKETVGRVGQILDVLEM